MFQPDPGAAVQAAWGQAVAEVVVQHFATTAERDTNWTTPPIGSLCHTADTDTLWYRRGSGWYAITGRTYAQVKAWVNST